MKPNEPQTDDLLPTRQSLLSRLHNGQDQDGWREFFDTYWRLIYNVARQAGLDDCDAQEVVQTTFIYLSRRMPRFHYDRTRGSFKAWLGRVTRSRISVYRRRAEMREPDSPIPHLEDVDEVNLWESVSDPSPDPLEAVWQREWEQHLIDTALRRIRVKVSAQQLMIFELAALGEVPLPQVARKLEVSLMQIYLARHRVGRLFKAEIERLRLETE